MHGRARAIIAVMALSIFVLPVSSKQARAAIDCAVLSAKIAELEKPIHKLREVVKGLAAVVARGSEVGISPTHTLLLMDQRDNLSHTLAKLRADTAANEPVLRGLRGVKAKHCSGQPGVMVHAAPQYVPATRVYGSPVVTYRRTNLRPRTYTSPRVASYAGKKHAKRTLTNARKKHTAKVHKRTHTQQANKKSGKAKKVRNTSNKRHKRG